MNDLSLCTVPLSEHSSTRSHASEVENRTRNRSKNCKCKPAFRLECISSALFYTGQNEHNEKHIEALNTLWVNLAWVNV